MSVPVRFVLVSQLNPRSALNWGLFGFRFSLRLSKPRGGRADGVDLDGAREIAGKRRYLLHCIVGASKIEFEQSSYGARP